MQKLTSLQAGVFQSVGHVNGKPTIANDGKNGQVAFNQNIIQLPDDRPVTTDRLTTVMVDWFCCRKRSFYTFHRLIKFRPAKFFWRGAICA